MPIRPAYAVIRRTLHLNSADFSSHYAKQCSALLKSPLFCAGVSKEHEATEAPLVARDIIVSNKSFHSWDWKGKRGGGEKGEERGSLKLAHYVTGLK